MRKKSLIVLLDIKKLSFSQSWNTLLLSNVYSVSKKKYLDKNYKKAKITIEEIKGKG